MAMPTVNIPQRGNFQGYTLRLGERGDLSRADLEELLVSVVTDLWAMADGDGTVESAVNFEEVIEQARARFLSGVLPCHDGD